MGEGGGLSLGGVGESEVVVVTASVVSVEAAKDSVALSVASESVATNCVAPGRLAHGGGGAG